MSLSLSSVFRMQNLKCSLSSVKREREKNSALHDKNVEACVWSQLVRTHYAESGLITARAFCEVGKSFSIPPTTLAFSLPIIHSCLRKPLKSTTYKMGWAQLNSIIATKNRLQAQHKFPSLCFYSSQTSTLGTILPFKRNTFYALMLFYFHTICSREPCTPLVQLHNSQACLTRHLRQHNGSWYNSNLAG